MNSQYLAYICNRVQKITEAVYRVTDLFPDKEPVKWEIREKAISVFTNLTSSRNQTFLERNVYFQKIELLIDQLIILFSLFSETEVISSANFEVLKQEYSSIKKFVSREKQKENFTEFFLSGNFNQTELSNGHGNRHSNGQSSGHPLVIQQKKEKIAKNLYSSTKARKDKIFDIIKNKKEISIGDISVLFKECSEKTIQRDLLEMVKKGLLKKQGDKRWRKYMLTD